MADQRGTVLRPAIGGGGGGTRGSGLILTYDTKQEADEDALNLTPGAICYVIELERYYHLMESHWHAWSFLE
jgi:hypothetical protein